MLEVTDFGHLYPSLDGLEYYIVHPNAKTEIGRLLSGESAGDFMLPNHYNVTSSLGEWENLYEAILALEVHSTSKWVRSYEEKLDLYAPITKNLENKITEWMTCRIRELWYIEQLLINTKRLPFYYAKKELVTVDGVDVFVQLPTHDFMNRHIAKIRNVLRHRNGVARPSADHKMKRKVES